jgi:hypothetical protein
VFEAAITETWRQPARIEVTQSLNAVIITIGVDTNVAFNTNVARKGVIIKFIINLGHK